MGRAGAAGARHEARRSHPSEKNHRPCWSTPRALFDRTEIGSGLLLGTGQIAVGVSPEMAATAFQAMIGAVFVGTGYPRSLAQVWPAEWDAVLAEMVPAAPHDADPTTILQQYTNALRLRVEREHDVSGPAHATTYVTTTTLISDALGV